MKALPVKKHKTRTGWEACPLDEATHVTLNIPGPTGKLTLPFILKGSRDESHCWTWNGDTECPTLRPSILTNGHDFRCHSWVNAGKAQFLGDCSHEFANTTVELLEVG